jgi:putative ABC transport system ATP-binding protein
MVTPDSIQKSSAVGSGAGPEFGARLGSDRLISLRDLVKNYATPAGDVRALKGVDLQVHRGEFLAVVGKSGAGKSTLINMVSGIDRPTSGEILFDGRAIHALDENQKARWRCRNMGMVFQFFQLIPNLNLVENLTIAMDFCDSYPLKAQKERALHLLEQVGIAAHAYKTPARISGGQQQRVAVARALANDPAVIVADEPTGNLDSRTAGEMYALFASLVDQGKTLLVVTHDKEVTRQATRNVEIVDGRIAGPTQADTDR